MMNSDNGKSQEVHECCEDLGNKSIFKYQDSWTLYHHPSDTAILTDINFCPFCGVRLT